MAKVCHSLKPVLDCCFKPVSPWQLLTANTIADGLKKRQLGQEEEDIQPGAAPAQASGMLTPATVGGATHSLVNQSPCWGG